MSSNYPELVFNETEDFTADRLNKAMQVLDQRLRSLEPFTPSWEAAVNELRAVGLSRLNDAILPAYERIQLLSEMGFLFAGSNTSVTLVQDQSATFTINDEVERDLFTPTPFLALTRSSTVADYAIAQLISYDNDTGQLMVMVKSITGSPGPHTDWEIGATAASTIAAMEYFTQIDAARVAAQAAKTVSDTNAAQTAADRTQTTADRAAALAYKNAAETAAANAATWDPTNYATITYVTASLGNRLRIDTATQGLDGTQQQNGRTNLGLGASSIKDVATATMLRANTGSDVITVDQAWAANSWVNLGNISGAVNIDARTGVRFFGVMIGNVVIDVSNLKNGQPIEIVLVQDATGGRTVSWSSKFLWPSAAAPEVYTAPNGIAVVVTGVANWDANAVFAAGWKVTA